MIKISLFLFLLTGVLYAQAQDPYAQKCKHNVLIMSYNVENLFDTIDDPHKLDNDFLPESKKQWTSARYQTKLEHLARVISSADKQKLPDILGLVEVENQKVLEDLSAQNALRKGHYKIVHRESPDIRGIDVALLYNSKKFALLNEQFYTVRLEGNKRFKTRQILYAKLLFKKSGDTLHIFVNHWPSRRGGQAKSEPKRMAAAQTLKQVTDSIFHVSPQPKIVIMGDFNDETDNLSIDSVLQARAFSSTPASDSLYNTAANSDKQKDGTYYYWKTKEWNMLDQIIVSGALENSSGKQLRLLWRNMNILREDFFLYENKDGIKAPAKTYGGRKYYGGYSDHLPVYIYLYFKPKKKCLTQDPLTQSF
jgi:predicted extracellular nuclease